MQQASVSGFEFVTFGQQLIPGDKNTIIHDVRTKDEIISLFLLEVNKIHIKKHGKPAVDGILTSDYDDFEKLWKGLNSNSVPKIINVRLEFNRPDDIILALNQISDDEWKNKTVAALFDKVPKNIRDELVISRHHLLRGRVIPGAKSGNCAACGRMVKNLINGYGPVCIRSR